MVTTYRVNIFGEEGFLGYKEFHTLYDAMECSSECLKIGSAAEILRIEPCCFNAMSMADGQIVQTDEDGFAYICKKLKKY